MKEKQCELDKQKVLTLPNNFEIVARQYLNKEITNKKACEILGMTRGSFFRYLKELEIK